MNSATVACRGNETCRSSVLRTARVEHALTVLEQQLSTQMAMNDQTGATMRPTASLAELETQAKRLSADVITIETFSASARHDLERMIAGDAALERAFAANGDVRTIRGPVAVRGAQPGDVVELRIIDARFRPSVSAPYRGRSFGCQVGRERRSPRHQGMAARIPRRSAGASRRGCQRR